MSVVVGFPKDAPCKPGWLATEYLVRQRPVTEIAATLDCEVDTVRSLLGTTGIVNSDIDPAERARPRFDRLVATVSGHAALPARRLCGPRDEGFGWGRECVDPECDTVLHHLHEGDRCYLHERVGAAA